MPLRFTAPPTPLELTVVYQEGTGEAGNGRNGIYANVTITTRFDPAVVEPIWSMSTVM